MDDFMILVKKTFMANDVRFLPFVKQDNETDGIV